MPFFVWLVAMLLLVLVNLFAEWMKYKENPQTTSQENRVFQRTPRPRYWVEGNTVHQYEGGYNER